MLVLRSLLFAVGQAAFTILVVFPALLMVLVPYHYRHAFLSQWSRLVLGWLALTCNLRYQVIGRENIPAGPAVVLAKHQSAWETIAMQQIFPAQTWVLKRELLWIPVFGWGLALMRPVAIDRTAGKEALRQVIKQGTDRLRQGIWMVVFPEGTRVRPGSRGRYAIGGAMLATKAAAPVVPVAHNAGEFWGKGSFIKRPGTITLSVGPVIPTEGRNAADVNREAEAWIEQEMERISKVKNEACYTSALSDKAPGK